MCNVFECHIPFSHHVPILKDKVYGHNFCATTIFTTLTYSTTSYGKKVVSSYKSNGSSIIVGHVIKLYKKL